MLNLELEKKELLMKEIIELKEKANSDSVYDINTTYNYLKSLIKDVSVGINELDKISALNKKIDNLLKETIDFNNNLKAAVDSASINTNSRKY